MALSENEMNDLIEENRALKERIRFLEDEEMTAFIMGCSVRRHLHVGQQRDSHVDHPGICGNHGYNSRREEILGRSIQEMLDNGYEVQVNWPCGLIIKKRHFIRRFRIKGASFHL